MQVAAQIGILLLGGAAIMLLAFEDKRVSRWGWLIGLCSQPCWLYAMYTSRQWGVFALSVWYTAHYARGTWTFFVRRKPCQ